MNEQELKAHKLILAITVQLEIELIERWRGSHSVEAREEAWNSLQQLTLIAGAIEDGITKYGTNGN